MATTNKREIRSDLARNVRNLKIARQGEWTGGTIRRICNWRENKRAQNPRRHLASAQTYQMAVKRRRKRAFSRPLSAPNNTISGQERPLLFLPYFFFFVLDGVFGVFFIFSPYYYFFLLYTPPPHCAPSSSIIIFLLRGVERP